MRIGMKAIYVGNLYEELKDKVVKIDKYPNGNMACEVAYGNVVYECLKTELRKLQLEFPFMEESP